jgi:hypothetical protein
MGHNISFDRMMRDNECYQDDPQRIDELHPTRFACRRNRQTIRVQGLQ